MSPWPTDAERRAKRELERYRELLGRDPVTRFPEDPDWLYKGGKAEFEQLQHRMGLIRDDGGPVKIEGQEQLFDA